MFRVQNTPAIRTEAGQHTAEAIEQIVKVINSLAKQQNFDPAGVNVVPQPPASLNITAANGIANIQIVDNNPNANAAHYHGIAYYVEAATDAGFKNVVHVEAMGASRNKNIFLGSQTLYFRVYSQTTGSQPSLSTACGQNPVTCGGVAAPTQQPYQGSGTSPAISGKGAGLSPGNKVVLAVTP